MDALCVLAQLLCRSARQAACPCSFLETKGDHTVRLLETGIRNISLSQQIEKQNAFSCKTLFPQKASEKELLKITKAISAVD